MRERIVAGNWKLHGDRVFARALLDEVIAARPAGVRLAIFPPLPYLGELVDRYGAQGLEFGAQDVDPNEQGAYTGEVSARMLCDVGCRFAMVGHSERRHFHQESSELVAAKFFAARRAGDPARTGNAGRGQQGRLIRWYNSPARIGNGPRPCPDGGIGRRTTLRW